MSLSAAFYQTQLSQHSSKVDMLLNPEIAVNVKGMNVIVVTEALSLYMNNKTEYNPFQCLNKFTARPKKSHTF